MTEDFVAGVDWFLDLSRLFTPAEMRLIWALKKAKGECVSEVELCQALNGRKFVGSNVVLVHLGRIRARTLGMNMQIVSERGKGWRMVEVGKEAA